MKIGRNIFSVLDAVSQSNLHFLFYGKPVIYAFPATWDNFPSSFPTQVKTTETLSLLLDDKQR